MTTPLVRPFAGLRPAPELASEVAAPPYDVVSSDEARALAEGHPLSFLHISKPEIDLPSGTDVHAPEVYAKGAENMERMIADGVIRRDGQPCYYVYRIQMGDHVQTGIVGGGSVAAYDDNRIRRHEFTRPEKEDDRVNQIEAVNAQTGPVFTVHHPDAGIDGVVNKMTQTKPVYEVDLPGTHHSTHHSLWVVDDAADIGAISDAFDAMDVIYIADGHHRSAAASRVAVSRAAKDSASNGDQPYDYFLIVSFPTDAVQIFDYNRVVKDLNDLDREQLLARIGETFDVTESSVPAKPKGPQTFGMYLDGTWYGLSLKQPPGSDATPVERLDVSLLADKLLSPVLGIGDMRTDKRIDFIGGIRGMEGLEARVDGGDWAVAFALYPTSIADLISVADAGDVMPPKSTWFEPKLADGLVSLALD
ncbi:MAG: DUF1015 domain-containing protein [Rhodospirillales bacterium]|nr:DUF1015 domain-containing protein [Rhodospirillales bacterium]MBT4007608.1 DUF1015 domain-containing protein [Rhodospirillales bacterium]MBT5076646.1 DUF1015 domain-containing protein [Rhodospirillales bacterium]MBT5113732.1 DUF1015 domain-containing protein [Rhodospirillales bacterium]MBT5674034.1 DUF1015 domain-containing protein [Rhodospirillales bacterium]